MSNLEEQIMRNKIKPMFRIITKHPLWKKVNLCHKETKTELTDAKKKKSHLLEHELILGEWDSVHGWIQMQASVYTAEKSAIEIALERIKPNWTVQ